jgi:signal transduction histidine kinase
MDEMWQAHARRVFEPYSGRVTFQYLFGLPLDDLFSEVAALPEHTIVYYTHVFQDGAGKTVVPAHVLESLSYRANAPIYGHVDTYVGRGAVGGRVFRFASEGRTAAQLALRILAGETPQQIGVQPTGTNSYLFDARQLKRWHIDPQLLPAGSEIRFQEPGFWDLYKWQAMTAIGVCLVQSLLILGLLRQRANWRRAEQRFHQAAESLRASQRELRQLSGSLIGAQESERCRIARELHDDFNQSLAMLSVEIDLLQQSLPASAAAAQPKMADLAARVRQLSSSIHELSHELHPLKLEQLGLVAAVRGLCADCARSHHVDIEFKAEGLPDSVAPDTALCLYRITQEGLRNVVKHSGALAASVHLHGTADEIGLTILDCGRGFDPQSNSSNQGLGFVSMRERLRLVGGTLTIETQANHGVQLRIHVPHSLPLPPDAELQSQLDVPTASD